jgi:excisionase family DNA binding protein
MGQIFLTTHNIARMIGVSPSAVLSWIDKGLIVAHRTPGGHRRVEKGTLLKFLREQKMPVPRELVGVSRLLVVDDDPAFLRTVVRLLKQRAPRLTLETATNPVDGLLKISTFQPDAVLLDAYMPQMNGIEVCQKIHESAETAHIVVIAVTGRPSAKVAAAFREAGAIACLTKPLDADQLVDMLTNPPIDEFR